MSNLWNICTKPVENWIIKFFIFLGWMEERRKKNKPGLPSLKMLSLSLLSQCSTPSQVFDNWKSSHSPSKSSRIELQWVPVSNFYFQLKPLSLCKCIGTEETAILLGLHFCFYVQTTSWGIIFIYFANRPQLEES